MTPAMMVFYRRTLQKYHQISETGKVSGQRPEGITARLWIFPLLAILFYMHALVIYVSIFGVSFI
jgi:hypothetical protein